MSLSYETIIFYIRAWSDPVSRPRFQQPYSRLDADAIYRISTRKIKIDAGISVLNVLNTENIRYSNYTRVPTVELTNISLYAEAVPFTPALFLKISY